MTRKEIDHHITENYQRYRVFVSTILKSATAMHGIRLSFDEVEDYVQIGMINLLQCLEKFDKSQGVPFENFAYIRIYGGFIDEHRRRSPIPRREQDYYKKYQLLKRLALIADSPFKETECAESMGITVTKLRKLVNKWNVVNSVSIDDIDDSSLPSEDCSNPEKILFDSEIKSSILSSLELLNQREKKVIYATFFYDTSVQELAQLMGLSVGRISQIKKESMEKIKRHFI